MPKEIITNDYVHGLRSAQAQPMNGENRPLVTNELLVEGQDFRKITYRFRRNYGIYLKQQNVALPREVMS